MKATYHDTDRVWALAGPQIDLTPAVIRHLGVTDGWRPGTAPTALVRGTGHPSHVLINGWPYAYIGTTEDQNTLYQTY
jgi:hypothetical protein